MYRKVKDHQSDSLLLPTGIFITRKGLTEQKEKKESQTQKGVSIHLGTDSPQELKAKRDREN